MLHTISLHTDQKEQMVDLVQKLNKIIALEKVDKGMLIVYSAHTTAGITINENADPTVMHDLLKRLDQMCPQNYTWDQHDEGNSAAHLKASLIGTSQTVFIDRGALVLGRWQSIYFCEFDGPRPRTCMVKVIKD